MNKFTVSVQGQTLSVVVKARRGAVLTFEVDGQEYAVEVQPSATATPSTAPAKANAPRGGFSGEVRAPIPGIVSDILVTPGAIISTGDTLAVIEAMKMENPIKTAHGGVIDEVRVTKGQEVPNGAVLITLRGQA